MTPSAENHPLYRFVPSKTAFGNFRLGVRRVGRAVSWNSSRLEGNTYSLLDTRRLIEFGQEAHGRDRLEAQMILNHKDAVEFLVGNAAGRWTLSHRGGRR